MKEKQEDIDLSIVIPVYNEEKSLPSLHAAILRGMKKLSVSYEILYVDDGSSDRSYEVLKMQFENSSNVRVIRLRRNFGQTAALAAGFHHALGEVIVTMDADFQNDPNDIGLLIAKIKEGYDVVSGWRINRKDRWLTRKVPSYLANKIISGLTGVHLHDYGCGLKAYRRDTVEHLNLYGEMHRFIPALVSWMGVKLAEVPVSHHLRQHGRSKYGISRTVQVILDMINVKFMLSYATRPIQIFGGIGLFAFLTGGLVEGLTIGMKIYRGTDMTGNPFFYLGILLILMGAQFITMGLLGEMNIRIYHESQNKPVYVIREFLQNGE